MVKILITGGSGFIGSNLIEYFLNSDGIEVLNIDKEIAQDNRISAITKICDIRDYEKLHRLVQEFDPSYIVHLAARTDLDGNTIEDYSSNTDGVRNIIQISKDLDNLKKILITSSMLVCKAGYYPKSNVDYCPTTLYGESKVLTEKITIEEKPNCKWYFLRPTSIWGPGFKVPYRNFFDMVMKGYYFHIGKKSCTKTYGYVGNTIYQIQSILFSEKDIPNGEVFYLGDPALNIETWANNIAGKIGQKIYRVPFFLIKTAAKLGDILKNFNIIFPMTSFRLKNMTTDNIIDLSKTQEIAPNPPYSVEMGIEKTIQWLKEGS